MPSTSGGDAFDARQTKVVIAPLKVGSDLGYVRRMTSGSTGRSLGIWFIGARGSLATTATVGVHALAGHLTDTTGCVTAHPELDGRGLAAYDAIRTGGHDISTTPLLKQAERLVAGSVVHPAVVAHLHDDLDAAESRLRPGLDPTRDEPQRAAIDRLSADIRDFGTGVDRVVVVDVSSTEPPHDPGADGESWAALEAAWAAGRAPLAPSSAYACAALLAGASYVAFTPSPGIDVPALRELADDDWRAVRRLRRQDGRDAREVGTGADVRHPGTGRAVVDLGQPAGRRRRRDADRPGGPARARPPPSAAGWSRCSGTRWPGPMHIDFVDDLGDWKTAWDHVRFDGFLGARMTMQFTWEGCDSALAAPLVLDLARLVGRAHEVGETGRAARPRLLLQAALRLRRAPAGRAVVAPCVAWSQGLRRRARAAPMKLGDLAELVRAPAAMTVPGDCLVGRRPPARPARGGWLMPASSTCLYWSGMAFNDWCDREVDADERPERPIPSGRVSPPATALAVAAGLGVAGVAISAAVGGRRGPRVSLPLAALICAYDGVAKDSPAGPLVMASTRCLDVLLGAYAGPGQRLGTGCWRWPPTPSASPRSAAARCTAARPVVAAGVHGHRRSRWPPARRTPRSATRAATQSEQGGRRRCSPRRTPPSSAARRRGPWRTRRRATCAPRPAPASAGSPCCRAPGWPAAAGSTRQPLVVAGGPLLKAASTRMSPT